MKCQEPTKHICITIFFLDLIKIKCFRLHFMLRFLPEDGFLIYYKIYYLHYKITIESGFLRALKLIRTKL